MTTGIDSCKINSMSDEKKTHVEAVQELRRSGAYGKHQDQRDKRARTRKAKMERVLKDQED